MPTRTCSCSRPTEDSPLFVETARTVSNLQKTIEALETRVGILENALNYITDELNLNL